MSCCEIPLAICSLLLEISNPLFVAKSTAVVAVPELYETLIPSPPATITIPLALAVLSSADITELDAVKPAPASNVARAAIPVGTGLLANAVLGRGERNLAGQVTGIGGGGAQNVAGLIGYNAVTGEPIVGPAVPPGMGGYGGTPPIGGNPIDVLE